MSWATEGARAHTCTGIDGNKYAINRLVALVRVLHDVIDPLGLERAADRGQTADVEHLAIVRLPVLTHQTHQTLMTGVALKVLGFARDMRTAVLESAPLTRHTRLDPVEILDDVSAIGILGAEQLQQRVVAVGRHRAGHNEGGASGQRRQHGRQYGMVEEEELVGEDYHHILSSTTERVLKSKRHSDRLTSISKPMLILLGHRHHALHSQL